MCAQVPKIQFLPELPLDTLNLRAKLLHIT